MMSSGLASRANSAASVGLEAGSTASASGASTQGASGARRRHKAKDDAIRRKIDQELMRKSISGGRRSFSSRGSAPSPNIQAGNIKAGTVAALRPSPPTTIRQSMRVLDGAQLMAARRCDALLVVDQQDRLCGIVTDKDIAFRVVAEGLDPHSTKIFEIMTKNVQFVNANATASEALTRMIEGGFRHLPVMDDEGDVVGVLDITKCLYSAISRFDKIYGTSKKLTDALEDVQRDWVSSGVNPALAAQFETLRQKMLCPDLSSILCVENLMPPELNLRATVKEAARKMKEFKSTAILIFEDGHRLAGIFTSKDVVLRVLAVKADPITTSIVRVMTPSPDTVDTTVSIHDALKLMHNNRYLHLPVVDSDGGEVIGLVDVLKLTYNVLDKLSSSSESDGPAWAEFWSAFAPESQIGSQSQLDAESSISHPISPASQQPPHPHPIEQIRPSDSASVISDALTLSASTLVPGFDREHCFVFKFRDPSNPIAVHRITAPTSLSHLVTMIQAKTGSTVEINSLSYPDEDGDDIAIQNDADLVAAVAMARDAGLKRILLTVNGVSASTASQLPPPPGSTLSVGDDGDSVTRARTISHASSATSFPRASSRLGGSEVGAYPSLVPTQASTSAPSVPPKHNKTLAEWIEHTIHHPAALVGAGALVTLSVVGLVSLIRR